MARDNGIVQKPFTFSNVLRGLLGPSLDETVLATCQLLTSYTPMLSEREAPAAELHKRLKRSEQKIKLLKEKKKILESEVQKIEDQKKLALEEAAEIARSKAAVNDKRKALAQNVRKLKSQAIVLEREQADMNKEETCLPRERIHVAQTDPRVCEQAEKETTSQKEQIQLLKEKPPVEKPICDDKMTAAKNKPVTGKICTCQESTETCMAKDEGDQGTSESEEETPTETTTITRGRLKSCECTVIKNMIKESIPSFAESTDYEGKCLGTGIFDAVQQDKNLQFNQPCIQRSQLQENTMATSRVQNKCSGYNWSLNRPKFKRKKGKTRNSIKMQPGYKSLESYFTRLPSSSSDEYVIRNRNNLTTRCRFLQKPPNQLNTSPDTTDSSEQMNLRRTRSATRFGLGAGDVNRRVPGKPVITKTIWAVTKINKYSDGSEIIELRTPLTKPPRNVPRQIDRMMVVNSKQFR